jgi:cation:H+ antiporter
LGAAIAVWATERLLEGLVGLALLAGLSTFVVAALLSGLEAENIAVGLAAGHQRLAAVALGSVFGGASFLVCVALGLGAIIAPLDVRLPRSFLVPAGVAPVIAGLPLLWRVTPRWTGAALLVSFGVLMALLIAASRRTPILVSEEIERAGKKRPRLWQAAGLTLLGVAAVTLGGELVAEGARRIILQVGVPALLMGMVVAPAAIELEEVVRQAVPARAGHPEVSAGNMIGTLLYFSLFNLGIITLLTPIETPSLTRVLDWPFLVLATWLGLLFLWRGRLGRVEGGALLLAYAGYVALHVVLR